MDDDARPREPEHGVPVGDRVDGGQGSWRSTGRCARAPGRPGHDRSARSRIPRSIRRVITKLTTVSGSTISRAHHSREP